MPGTGGPDLAALRDDQLKRVLERYETSAKEFRSVLGALSAFALGFFLLILLPYVSIQREHQRIAQRLPQAAEQVRARASRLEAYGRVQSGIGTLRGAIQNGPQKLREFVRSLPPSPDAERQARFANQQAAQRPMAQVAANAPPEPADPCAAQAGEDWANCKVKQEVLRQFEEYDRILNTDVLPPFKVIEPGRSLINADKLQTDLRALHTSFEKTLNTAPRFWHTYSRKEGMFVQLEHQFEAFWNDYDAAIARQSRELEEQRVALEQERNELQKKEQALEAQREQLANRLSAIDSPFGKLPVGLNESVLAFPVLLAAAFLILTGRFCDTLRLRSVFRALTQEIDPQRAVWTDSHVALVAPLWIDPLDAAQSRTVRWIGLLAPLIAFIAATAAIGYGWSISESFLTEDPSTRRLYGALYVVSAVAFLLGCGRVARRVRGASR